MAGYFVCFFHINIQNESPKTIFPFSLEDKTQCFKSSDGLYSIILRWDK